MRTVPLACLLALAVLPGARAQTSGQEEKKKGGTLIDAAKKLLGDKDKISDDAKKRAEDAAKAAMQQVPDDLKNKARSLVSDPKAAEARSQAIDTVKSVVQKQQPDAPAAAQANAVPAAPPAPSGPRPQPLQPLALDDPQTARTAKKGQTVITATKSAFFDAESGKGIYTGDVRARHPQMAIDCEELEIHMKKQEEGAPKKKPVAATDTDILATGKKAASNPADSGIEMAYARGSMVTIEKRTEEGELQIAHCNEQAIYDGTTGNITLRGWPSVQRGNKLIEATDPRTYMIIDQKGKLTVLGGPQRTTLIDEKVAGEQPASPGIPESSAPAATTPAGTPPR